MNVCEYKDCNTVLSVYNDDIYCGACMEDPIKTRERLLNMSHVSRRRLAKAGRTKSGK